MVDKVPKVDDVKLYVIEAKKFHAMMGKMSQRHVLPDTIIKYQSIKIDKLISKYLLRIQGYRFLSTIQIEKGYLAIFSKMFGKLQTDELNGERIQYFLKERQYGANSCRFVLKTLNCLFKHGIEIGCLVENPIAGLKLPKMPKTIPKFVDIRLIDRILRKMRGRIKLYFMILRYTGMRPGEALALKVGNVKKTSCYNRKTNQTLPYSAFVFKSPKTNNERLIPIHKNLIQTLEKYIQDKPPNEHLFKSKSGEGHQKSMQSALKRCLTKMKLKGVNVYTFRHSVATELLAKTGDLRAVQTILGHASSKTTEIYAHALESVKVSAIGSL